jgi:Activator of Hsp90 ATPase homolog 1-like protein
MQETLVVRREQHVPAPPAAVFALLTDPEKILRWMGTEAQVEPQPGGLYLVNVTGARFARALSARWCRCSGWCGVTIRMENSLIARFNPRYVIRCRVCVSGRRIRFLQRRY